MGDVLEAKGFTSEQEELEQLRRRSALLFNENIDLKVKLEEHEQQAIDVRQLAVTKAKFGAALAMSLIEAGYVVVREAWDKDEDEGEGIKLLENATDEGKGIVHAYQYGEETGCLYFPEPEDLVANDWMIVLDIEALDAEAAHADAEKNGENATAGFPSIPLDAKTMQVKGCSSCGEDHESATVLSVDLGGGTFTCPNSGNPVNFTYPTDPIQHPNVVPGVTEGRMVHYVMLGHQTRNNQNEHRPALIVNAHGGQLLDGMVNLTVFLDGLNDVYTGPSPTLSLGSVKYSETKEPGTWHWPERA